MSCNEFYVYQYINEDGSPFYIGKRSTEPTGFVPGRISWRKQNELA